MIDAYARITVAVPGTPVRVTVNEPDPSASKGCHAVLIQVLKGNTGNIYIGKSTMNRTTEASVMVTLGVPNAAAGVIPSFQAALTLSPGGIQLRDLYIDADNATDGVKVTILVT